MKLIHLADLHIGKTVNGFSMLDDQRCILDQISRIAGDEKPDAVVIAGDVYDKPVPSSEAVALLDDFLYGLSRRHFEVFVISGNHDSPERLSFGGRMMGGSGIHIAPVYKGRVEPFTVNDRYGKVKFWLLPFIKPSSVRPYSGDKEISSYTDALEAAIDAMVIDRGERNVLVTHQFVTGAGRSGSEEISVGGTDNVDASVFADFDYVALGHIHGAQDIGKDHRIRYCGTPLKYSFSEASHIKSVTVAELGEKGTPVSVRKVPLKPLHDMREIRGSYSEVTALDFYKDTAVDDYLHVTLTDEEDVPEAYAKLRVIYPNLMKVDYDNTRTRSGGCVMDEKADESLTPEELFAQFYELRNGHAMSAGQQEFADRLMEKIWGEMR